MDCYTQCGVSCLLPHFPLAYLFTMCKVKCGNKLAGVYVKSLKALYKVFLAP